MSVEFYGPYELVANIYVTNGDMVGKVEMSLGHGQKPTQEALDEAMAKAAGELPEGFRIMNKREWWDEVSIENFGGRTAFPGDPDKWSE